MTIDEILDSLQSDDSLNNFQEAKAKITKLIDEARIDELDRLLHDKSEPYGLTDNRGKNIWIYRIQDRIKQLQGEDL